MITNSSNPEKWKFHLLLSQKKIELERSLERILGILFPFDVHDFESWFLQSNSSDHRQEFVQILGLPVMQADQLATFFNDPTVFGGALKYVLQRRLYYSLSALQEAISHPFAPAHWNHLYGPRIQKLFSICGEAIEPLDERDVTVERCVTDKVPGYADLRLKLLRDRTGVPLHDKASFLVGVLEFLTFDLDALATLDESTVGEIAKAVEPYFEGDTRVRLMETWQGDAHHLRLVSAVARLARLRMEAEETVDDSHLKACLNKGIQGIRKSCYSGEGAKAEASTKADDKVKEIRERFWPDRALTFTATFLDLPEIHVARRFELFRLVNLMALASDLQAIDLMDAKFLDGFHSKDLRTIPYLDWHGDWTGTKLDQEKLRTFIRQCGANSHPWWMSYELVFLYSYLTYVRVELHLDSRVHENRSGCFDVFEAGEEKLTFWKPTAQELRRFAEASGKKLAPRWVTKAVGIMILGPPGTGKSTLVQIMPELFGFKAKGNRTISLQYMNSAQDMLHAIDMARDDVKPTEKEPLILLIDEFHSEVKFNLFSILLGPLEEGRINREGTTIEYSNLVLVFASSKFQSRQEFLAHARSSGNQPMIDFSTRILDTAWLEWPSFACLPHDASALLDFPTEAKLKAEAKGKFVKEVMRVMQMPLDSVRVIRAEAKESAFKDCF